MSDPINDIQSIVTSLSVNSVCLGCINNVGTHDPSVISVVVYKGGAVRTRKISIAIACNNQIIVSFCSSPGFAVDDFNLMDASMVSAINFQLYCLWFVVSKFVLSRFAESENKNHCERNKSDENLLHSYTPRFKNYG